jgi:hypothetical protein
VKVIEMGSALAEEAQTPSARSKKSAETVFLGAIDVLFAGFRDSARL